MKKNLELANILDGKVLAEFDRDLQRAAMDAVDRPHIEDARKTILTVAILPDEISGGWAIAYEIKVVTPPVKNAGGYLSRSGRQLVIEESDQTEYAPNVSDDEIDADMKQIGKRGKVAV